MADALHVLASETMGILADACDQHDFTDLYSSTRRSFQRRSKRDANRVLRMAKPSKLSVRPEKTRISLSLRCLHGETLGPKLPIEEALEGGGGPPYPVSLK